MKYLLVLVKFNEGVEVRASDLITVLSTAPMSMDECRVLKSKQSVATLSNPRTICSVIGVDRYAELVQEWVMSKPEVSNGYSVVNELASLTLASKLALKDAERAYWFLNPLHGNSLVIEANCND